MDGEIPNVPNVVQLTTPAQTSNQTPKGEYQTVPPKGKKGLIFEILFILIFLILAFGALNYFNILKLSEIFPNYLDWLPRKEVPTGTSQQSQQFSNLTITPTISPLKLSCPSIKEFCQIGSGIIKDGKYVGWGAVLASGSAIFAAFDGVLSSTESTFPKEEDGEITEKKFITAYLDKAELGLRAIYYFRGSIPKSGNVTKGEQIATASGRTISIYDDKSLIFSVIRGYPTVNVPGFLTKEDFE